MQWIVGYELEKLIKLNLINLDVDVIAQDTRVQLTLFSGKFSQL